LREREELANIRVREKEKRGEEEEEGEKRCRRRRNRNDNGENSQHVRHALIGFFPSSTPGGGAGEMPRRNEGE
jgi:hypothetical protein